QRWLTVCACVVLALSSSVWRPEARQAVLQTPAERVNFSQGGTLYEPLMQFVRDLDARSDLMSVQTLTQTLLGRDVVLCILSNPPIYRPEDIFESGKPVVLIVNNVHGGEVAGKDASLALMRDLVQGDLQPLLDDVVVLNVPTINPDGAEVRRRTNEQNFDMNRDYLKLESQEIGALVTRVLNVWQPHIWVDTHHGGSVPYTLTYQTNMNPGADAELVRFGNEEILARVRQALRADNYDGFWYTGPGRVDGVDGWVPTSVEPRKQHVYGAFANTIGFLYETPAGTHRLVDNGTRVVEIPRDETYRHQVQGQYIGQRELLRFAAERAADLKKTIGDARRRAVALGHDDTDNDQVVLEYRQVNKGNDDYWVRTGGGRGGRGGGGGEPAAPVTFERVNGPVFTRFEPTRTTTRPWGYLIPPGAAKVVPVLHDHQISVQRLTAPVSVEVEVYYATAVQHGQYFQGHYLRQVTATKRTETLELPAGTLFVPSGQARANLISYLLEPETDDNLVTWGYLDDFLRVTDGSGRAGGGGGGAPQAGRGGGGRGGQASPGQRIPIYRLMKKTAFAAELVQPYDGPAKNRYIR
ncbi:MAG TPA: DUF2817 domain-containing protein, partial [Vicinamibacterales bacterium]|nr:DUF2817 domain-containing protein [Vicinamibacterales bacterium]